MPNLLNSSGDPDGTVESRGRSARMVTASYSLDVASIGTGLSSPALSYVTSIQKVDLNRRR
jgi:hypothetical protein